MIKRSEDIARDQNYSTQTNFDHIYDACKGIRHQLHNTPRATCRLTRGK